MEPPCDNLILFDGPCNLCNAAVRFIIRHDRSGRYRFTSLQSELGRALCRGRGDGAGAPATDAMALFTHGRMLTGADAAVEIAGHLDGPWRCLGILKLLPRPLRDRLYAIVARRRHAWFGRGSCAPSPGEVHERFLT